MPRQLRRDLGTQAQVARSALRTQSKARAKTSSILSASARRFAADLFMLKHPGCVRDPARAAQILREGLARPLRDPQHWDLESRLEWAESEV